MPLGSENRCSIGRPPIRPPAPLLLELLVPLLLLLLLLLLPEPGAVRMPAAAPLAGVVVGELPLMDELPPPPPKGEAAPRDAADPSEPPVPALLVPAAPLEPPTALLAGMVPPPKPIVPPATAWAASSARPVPLSGASPAAAATAASGDTPRAQPCVSLPQSLTPCSRVLVPARGGETQVSSSTGHGRRSLSLMRQAQRRAGALLLCSACAVQPAQP